MAVYVVWTTQLGAREEHVPDATRLMSDSRVRHFWDGADRVGRLFGPELGLADWAAWDVWLLFDHQAMWPSVGAPVIAWWEHQIGDLPPDLHLDPGRFAGRALELQASARRARGAAQSEEP